MRSSVLRNVLLNNPLTAAGEALLHFGTAMVAMPLSGLAGLAAAPVPGLSAGDTVRTVGSALTYQPRGEMGQAATELVNYPFEKLAEGAHWAGDKTLDATGSPGLATAVDTGIQALPIILAKKGSGAFVLREEKASLISRVDEVHSALDPIAAKNRTTAAMDTEEGTRVLAAGGRDLSPAQRALLTPDEVAAKLPDAHAETTLLNYATQNDLTPTEMAVSRQICPACRAAIEQSGGQLTSPTTAVWPR